MGIRWRRPGWSALRFAWRSAAHHRRGQAIALAAVAGMTTACVGFAPVYDRAMQQALVDTLLQQADAGERVIAIESASTDTALGAEKARPPTQLRALLPETVASRLGPAVLGRTAVVTPAEGRVPPTGPLVWRENACDHVRILSGACPSASREIMVSGADAATFGLLPGSTVPVTAAVDGPDITLRVVGTYAPDATDWWQGLRLVDQSRITTGTDPSASHDAWLTTEETFVDSRVLPGETSSASALVPTTVDVDELAALAQDVQVLSADLRDEEGELRVLSALDDVVGTVADQTGLAHRTVPLLIAPVALLALFVLWLVLTAATEQRRGQVAVARLRGRGPVGAATMLTGELLPVLLAGLLPGAALALLGGAVARALLPGDAPFEAGPGFATAVLATSAALVLLTVAASVRVAREPLASLIGAGATARRWTIGVLDAALLAVVGTGVLAFATGGLTGPLALLGPALLALLAGLVLAQVVPPAATLLGRRLLDRGHLVAGVTLVDAGRRRATRTILPVLTLACALAVFAFDAVTIGERNRVNASEHDAGAPVVLRLDGGDLDGARAALTAADPTRRRATPVLVARDTLAVEPAGFAQVAFFPRGAPSAADWAALAGPARPPLTLTGDDVTLTVASAPGLLKRDFAGLDAEVRVGLTVTTATGVRDTIDLGPLPRAGGRARLEGDASACQRGCRLAAIELDAAQGVEMNGVLDLADLRVDGEPLPWGTSVEDWNATEREDVVLRPVPADSAGTLRVEASIRGFFEGQGGPAALTSAWVPTSIPALTTTRTGPDGLTVRGLDGSDRAAESVGRLVLVPAMPRRAALVDLDTITRGSAITLFSALEVWLADDARLLASVRGQLDARGIAVTDQRRYAPIRQAYEDTVPTWSLDLGAALGPAVLLLALFVLVALAVVERRDRARDLAIAGLNGTRVRTVRLIAACAQLPGTLVAVVAGIAAGVAGAAITMPEVAFLPTPPDVPVIDPATSWPAVAWVAGACLLLLPAATVLAGRAVARSAHPERVRETR